MRAIKFCVLLMILWATNSGCFKEDEKITPHPRGGVHTDTIPLTENYIYQCWFSLDSGKIIRKNLKNSSDLGFECSPDGWHILLNTSNFMKVADLGIVPFGIIQDTTGKHFSFDKSDGNPDSTVLDHWFEVIKNDTVSNGHVYAVDRGIDESGNPLGMMQVVFDSLKHGVYYFRFSPLSGGTPVIDHMTKREDLNYAWYSFKDKSAVETEPAKDTYDLLFTQYTTMLFTDAGEPYPYLVTGVLLNREGVVCALDTIHDFSAINKELANSLQYSSNLDAIGYDWKFYDFNSGAYTVRPGMIYIIRNRTGYIYKLRFIGFYDKNGSKGYPVIEYQAL